MMGVIDSDASVFIVTNDGGLIKSGEYDINEDGDGIFVMLTNDLLNPEYGDDNTVFLHWQSVKWSNDMGGMIWKKNDTHIDGIVYVNPRETPQFFNKRYEDAELSHFDGNRQTLDIINRLEQSMPEEMLRHEIPGIMRIHDTTVTYLGKTYHAYLPAIGQMDMIDKNVGAINMAFRTMAVSNIFEMLDLFGHHLHDIYWSSTAKNDKSSWSMQLRAMAARNSNEYKMLPVFGIRI